MYFDFARETTDMNVLPEEYFNNLKQYTDAFPETMITVIGHSDNRGTPQGNSRFSQLRANFVKESLIRYGINPDYIKTLSKSDTEPAA